MLKQVRKFRGQVAHLAAMEGSCFGSVRTMRHFLDHAMDVVPRGLTDTLAVACIVAVVIVVYLAIKRAWRNA